MSWADGLLEIQSTGSTTAKAGSLAGLHEARQAHQSQFFTTLPLSQFCWRLVEPLMERLAARDRILAGESIKISVLDNSVGSGRLLHWATPEIHSLYGVDVDEGCIASLSQAAMNAGFTYEFIHAGMEDVRPRHFDFCLANPPFSINLQSALLSPYECTSYGRFGPNTSTRSDAYALYQALDAAKWVVAILPTTMADEVFMTACGKESHPFKRLVALYDMPLDVFREENATVRVSVAVFDVSLRNDAPNRQRVYKLEEPVATPNLTIAARRQPTLAHLSAEVSQPAITRPVTGDSTVRVCHDGRWIRLKFQCGLTEAMVLNAIYQDRIGAHRPHAEHRYPKGVAYVGQGALDLQIHLAQPDPMASFWAFISDIGRAGGTPHVEAGLMGYLRRQIRVTTRQKAPFRHTVLMPGAGSGKGSATEGTAKKDHLIDPTRWGSPVIKAGTEVTFTEVEHGRYQFEHNGKSFNLPYEDILARFDLKQSEAQSEWKEVYSGLAMQFPGLAAAWRCRIQELGIDTWLNRGYQIDDLVELAIKRAGVVAWSMALGKARAALSIALLLGGKRALIVLKSALVDEMLIEIGKIKLDPAVWQVIESPEQLQSLRPVNIISVDRLKGPLTSAHPRITYAKKLRRRVGTIIPDEAHFLGNIDTEQTSAVWQVSAKRRFPLTGTPAGNYPRDCHGLLAFAGGDGTAAQPYGYRRYYLDPGLRHSMALAERGIDRVLNTFCDFVWVTREFEDELKGAKREVPRIANLAEYRQMLAPWVKRRVPKEPDVASCVTIPEPTHVQHLIEFDMSHLLHYLVVSEDFSSWYMAGLDEGKRNNLVAILARIKAVEIANNFPQHPKAAKVYADLTRKQRFCIDKLEELVQAGRRPLMFTGYPGNAELVARHLAKRDIDSVVIHGGKTIKRRNAEFESKYRQGDVPVALVTYGSIGEGTNIPQCSDVLLADKSWSARKESQAIARALRGENEWDVQAHHVITEHSIDTYMQQVVSFKADSFNAGFDWGTPTTSDEEFLHLDVIFRRFCCELSELIGVHSHDLRKHLEKETSHVQRIAA